MNYPYLTCHVTLIRDRRLDARRSILEKLAVVEQPRTQPGTAAVIDSPTTPVPHSEHKLNNSSQS